MTTSGFDLFSFKIQSLNIRAEIIELFALLEGGKVYFIIFTIL